MQVTPESAGGEEDSLEEAPGTWFLLPLLTSPTSQGSIIENHQLLAFPCDALPEGIIEHSF